MKKKKCGIFISKNVEGCIIWNNNIIVSDKEKHGIYIEFRDKWSGRHSISNCKIEYLE